MIEFTTQQVLTEQKNLAVSFSGMAGYYLNDESNPLTKRSGVEYCFRQFANDSSVLIGEDGIIYAVTSINPETLLPIGTNYDSAEERGAKTLLKQIEGKNILIAGSRLTVSQDTYTVYVVKDITALYDVINAMILRFILICAIGVTVGTLSIILLVRRGVRPLVALKNISRRIAVGEYGKRAKIQTRDEVGALAADFNTMADAVEKHISDLEEKAKRLQLFIGGITHEFKTPMTSVIIHSDTLLSADLNYLSEESARNSLMHIHGQCRWLESLTQKLLKLITLEEEIELKDESVQKLFGDVSLSTAEVLRERNTPLELDCKIQTLSMDYDLIKSLLINLIDNASKASESGQVIILRAYESTIEVQDSGKGIPQDEIEKVIDPFYMADRSRSKKTGGSGLGLALVKRVADAHKAGLIIESAVEKGTAVKIIFNR
jgi:signal transduction histidine kinase